jgi:hypothetical protein
VPSVRYSIEEQSIEIVDGRVVSSDVLRPQFQFPPMIQYSLLPYTMHRLMPLSTVHVFPILLQGMD